MCADKIFVELNRSMRHIGNNYGLNKKQREEIKKLVAEAKKLRAERGNSLSGKYSNRHDNNREYAAIVWSPWKKESEELERVQKHVTKIVRECYTNRLKLLKLPFRYRKTRGDLLMLYNIATGRVDRKSCSQKLILMLNLEPEDIVSRYM
ncbi:hypothetical protein HELRODRAFT_182129 [Helobdella robusta]|uniref:Uncharacterized protein n=1 Tax=Helobdella robusta TaxID=6412 RepID=T1FHT2_HELRO|nr:hypothetical protein HELRODRAFT_182129 [Helobdella robusta]ESN91272.1 hypothetical protein HELRODRAFT_182129 [Helobdella robusta]